MTIPFAQIKKIGSKKVGASKEIKRQKMEGESLGGRGAWMTRKISTSIFLRMHQN
jgi:hypothetical protein